MRYAVSESAAAAHDLEGIVSYLAEALKNPAAAKRVLDEYDALLSALEETPAAYPFVRDDLLASVGYRWVRVSSYMAFFTIDGAAAAVNVERIAHESRNWMKLLL